MKLAQQGLKYDYYVSDDGIIYRKSGKGFKEVPKRLSVRGVLEFKLNGKTTSYRKFVATALIPNPTGADKVFSISTDPMDSNPKKLYWVWTRERKHLTAQEALQRAIDPVIINYYTTGDKNQVIRKINSIIEQLKGRNKNNLVGELYLLIMDYLERNLLFDLKNDIIGTYVGLCKQQYRKKIKTIKYTQKHESNWEY